MILDKFINGCYLIQLLQEARTNVISRQLEINEVEKSLQQSVKAVEVLFYLLSSISYTA